MTTENLTTRLIADSTQFVKGVDQAESKLSGFADSAKALLGAAGIAGAAKLAVGAFTDMAERMDAIGKASDKLGIASEALVGLQHAAEQAGSSAAALEKGIIGIQKNVAAAAGGSKSLTKAFEDLGLSVQELQAQDPEQQFLAMADALSGVEDVATRNALAFQTMGKAGIDLTNTMALGSAGLEAMKKEAIDMGIALERDAIAQLEAFNDSVDRLGKRVQGVMNGILITFTPVMNGFTAFAEHAIKSYQAVGGAGDSMSDMMVDAFATLVGTLDRMTRILISGIDLGIKTTMTAAAEVVNIGISAIFKGFDLLPDQMKSWLGIGDPPHIDTTQWVADMGFAASEFKRAFTEAGDLGDVVRAGALAGTPGAPQIPGLPPTAQLIEAAKETGKATGTAVLEGVDEALNQAPELDPFQLWVERQQDILNSLANAGVNTMNQMSSSIGNAFGQAAVGAQDFGDAMERAMKQLTASIVAMVVETVIKTSIAAAMSAAMWKGPAILASTATLGKASAVGAAAVQSSLTGTGTSVPTDFFSGSFNPAGGAGGAPSALGVTVNNNAGASIGVQQTSGGMSIAVDAARDAVAQDFSDSLGAGAGIYSDALLRFSR